MLVGAGEGGGQSSVRRESGGRKLVQRWGKVVEWICTGEIDENTTYLPGEESLHKILRLL